MGDRKRSSTSCLIVGGGISGICMAIDLIRRNKCRDFIIIEKGNSFGGTWNDNTYPGCSCDGSEFSMPLFLSCNVLTLPLVPSSLYSYSFAQSPEWSEVFAPQDEILDYLIKVSEDHHLYKYVRFNTALEGAEWDSIEKKWVCKLNVLGGKEIELYQEYTVKADFLVTAVGQLNVPKWPTVPGLKDFNGKLMHSARWDWNYDIRGKRVAMIGNGSTAVQIAPKVAKVASSFVVYQRTPHWLVPRDNLSISEGRKQMYRRFPALLQYDRASTMRYRESLHGAVTDVHSKEAAELEALAKEFIMSQLPNRPDLWANLTPDYPVGCKRVVKSDDYLAIFRQKHVRLETSRITRIKSTSIECEEGETEFDLIICATGFETTSFFTDSLKIVGPDKDLQQIWKRGPRALYGMLAESLPNFAMLYGPNTNLGHNSIILMIEAQSRYISELVKEVVDARHKGDSLMITPKRAALERFNEDLQSELNQSSFANPGCNSWYKNADGLITTNWSRNVVDYQKLLEKVDWDDFELSGKNRTSLDSRSTYIGRIVEERLVDYTWLAAVCGSSLAIAAVVLRPRILPSLRALY